MGKGMGVWMDGNRNRAFLEKMMEAGRLQKEAILLLLPDKTKAHFTVIGHELKSMLMECLVDGCINIRQTAAESGKDSSNGHVRKVDIG